MNIFMPSGYVSQAARAILAAKDALQLRDSIVIARSANVAQRQNALAKKAGSLGEQQSEVAAQSQTTTMPFLVNLQTMHKVVHRLYCFF
jgi:hypothetical protein